VHDTVFMHPTLPFYGNLLEYLMNTQINVDETLVNKAAALAQNVSQEDIVALENRRGNVSD